MKKIFSFSLIFFGFYIYVIGQCDRVVFKTQTDIDSFTCSGPFMDLYFSDDNDGLDPITSLLPLRSKGINIVNGSVVIENCHHLKNLDGLDFLDSIGKNFEILNNDSLLLFNLDSLNFPFHFQHIDSSLIIKNNKSLKIINGFDSLNNNQIRIIINNHDSLVTIASFDFLEEIERFELVNNKLFNAPIFFPNLKSINDSLKIAENSNLQNCSWIRELIRFVGKSGYLIENNGANCNLEISGDTEPPGFADCPEDSEIINIGGQCTGVYNFIDPFATDNIKVESYRVTITSSKGDIIAEREAQAGMSFSQAGLTLGGNIIIYEAIDEAKNIGTCMVIVNLIDIEFPFITEELEDVTINTITQKCQGRYSIVFPSIIENCSIIDSRIVILNTSTLDTVYQSQAFEGVNYNIDLNPGQYVISIVVSDESSLSDISSAEIVVIDDNEVKIGECPPDVTVTSDESCNIIYSYTSPQLIGGCENSMILREIISETGSIVLNSLIIPNTTYNDTFPSGINQLLFRYINGVNSETCSVMVTAEKMDIPGVILTAEDFSCITYKGNIKADIDTINGSFSWTGPNGFTSDSLNNIVDFPGFYIFKLIQENGCTSEYGVNVFQGDSNVDFNVILGEINCEEGSRLLTIDKDFNDFNYKWSGPDSFSSTLVTANIRLSGWYHAEAEGDFGCYGIDSILIENDIIYEHILTIDGNSAEILITGGTPPFIYKWDGVTMESSVTGLENGTHNLRIVDGLGCLNDIPFEIMVSSIDIPDLPVIKIYPNPAAEVLSIDGLQNGITSVYNSQGSIMEIITRESNVSIDIKDWSSGIYFIKTKDSRSAKVIKFLKI